MFLSVSVPTACLVFLLSPCHPQHLLMACQSPVCLWESGYSLHFCHLTCPCLQSILIYPGPTFTFLHLPASSLWLPSFFSSFPTEGQVLSSFRFSEKNWENESQEVQTTNFLLTQHYSGSFPCMLISDNLNCKVQIYIFLNWAALLFDLYPPQIHPPSGQIRFSQVFKDTFKFFFLFQPLKQQHCFHS